MVEQRCGRLGSATALRQWSSLYSLRLWVVVGSTGTQSRCNRPVGRPGTIYSQRSGASCPAIKSHSQPAALRKSFDAQLVEWTDDDLRWSHHAAYTYRRYEPVGMQFEHANEQRTNTGSPSTTLASTRCIVRMPACSHNARDDNSLPSPPSAVLEPCCEHADRRAPTRHCSCLVVSSD